jgi:S-adenosylmethionine decarboxylase
VLVEMYECDPTIINDKKKVQEIMLEAVRRSKATIIDFMFHKFSPQGISGVVIIAESHFTIHTWPEYGYAAVDFFTCGNEADPWVAQEYVISAFKSKYSTSMEVKRGTLMGEVEKDIYQPIREGKRQQPALF